jgi:hypothetical protein
MRSKFIEATAAMAFIGSGAAFAQNAGHILRGASVGAAGGAIVNSLDHGQRYYRDSYGRKYYVDRYGRRHYR